MILVPKPDQLRSALAQKAGKRIVKTKLRTQASVRAIS
jgi:hypothetical protein